MAGREGCSIHNKDFLRMKLVEASRWSRRLAGLTLLVAWLGVIPALWVMHTREIPFAQMSTVLLGNAAVGALTAVAVSLVMGQAMLERRPGLAVRSSWLFAGCFFALYLLIFFAIGYLWSMGASRLTLAMMGSSYGSSGARLTLSLLRWLPVALSFWLALRGTLALVRLPGTVPVRPVVHAQRMQAGLIVAFVFLAFWSVLAYAVLVAQATLVGNAIALFSMLTWGLLCGVLAWWGAWLGAKFQRGPLRSRALLWVGIAAWLSQALLIGLGTLVVWAWSMGSGFPSSTAWAIGAAVAGVLLTWLLPFLVAWGGTRLVWRKAATPA
jgi:hypothetical protein